MIPRIWLTGARGMLGQAVMARLVACKQQVYGTTKGEVDITQAAAVRRFADALRPSHIINCAAYTQVDGCETAVDEAMAVNGAGPGHIAAAAVAVGAHVLHVSTDYVFDGTACVPYAEIAPCTPLGVYGRSKHAGEQAFQAALAAARYAGHAYVVRTSWLFGKGGHNFVRTMLRLFASRAELGVVADQAGRPTFCDDLAAAIVQLLGLDPAWAAPAPGGVYHFANTGEVTWHGFAEAILNAAQAQDVPLTCSSVRAITTADYPTPARRPAYSVLSTDKIAHVLGEPPRPWKQALGDYLADYWRQQTSAQGSC